MPLVKIIIIIIIKTYAAKQLSGAFFLKNYVQRFMSLKKLIGWNILHCFHQTKQKMWLKYFSFFNFQSQIYFCFQHFIIIAPFTISLNACMWFSCPFLPSPFIYLSFFLFLFLFFLFKMYIIHDIYLSMMRSLFTLWLSSYFCTHTYFFVIFIFSNSRVPCRYVSVSYQNLRSNYRPFTRHNHFCKSSQVLMSKAIQSADDRYFRLFLSFNQSM